MGVIMSDLFNTIFTICGVSVTCCCTLFLGLIFVLISRGRIMVLPVILSFAGSFLVNSISNVTGIFRGRGRIEDDDFDSGRTNLRSRADSIKRKYDPFADDAQPEDDADDVFNAQSVKPRSSADRFSSQPGKPPPRFTTSQTGKPPTSDKFSSQSANRPPTSGTTSSSPLPPPRANLTRKPTTDTRRRPNSIDDDFDSLQTPSLRDRRATNRRRNSNDYDDEVMGGIFGDDDGDDLI